MRSFAHTLICIASALSALPPCLAFGGELPVGGNRSRFVYKAEGKRISDVLNDFAASQGVPAIIDANVEGVVSGNFDAPSADFLRTITKAYSLIWYHDGTALYFYPAKAIQSRIYKLQGYEHAQVTRLLQSLQVRNAQQPLRYDAGTRTLMVYGAPRYVELVGLAVESLDIGAQDDNRKTVRVFPLRFATAADRTVGETTVPGLVSTLRAIYGKSMSPSSSVSDAAGKAINGPSSPSAGRALMSIAGLGASTGNPLNKSAEPSRSGQWSSQAGILDERSGMTPDPRRVRSPIDTAEADDPEKPRFEADETSNAVIIYGYPNRMRDFAELIKTLDVQPTLIELEAMVIDIASESVSSLGVDWSVGSNRLSLSTTSPQTTAPETTLLPGNPFIIGTVIADAGRSLIARVMALQGEGKARVVSKPKVLGVSNRPSIMQEKRVASIRVAGVLEASLHQIEAGTLLHVVPQVTRADPQSPTHIKMSLLIQDGIFETQQVDQLPVLKKTEIRTEAHVVEGESLLIGGITMESESSIKTGVPGVSSLPLLGSLFRQRGSHKERTERLFLITPRVIEDRPAVPVPAIAASAAVNVPATMPPPAGSLPLPQSGAPIPIYRQPLPSTAPTAAEATAASEPRAARAAPSSAQSVTDVREDEIDNVARRISLLSPLGPTVDRQTGIRKP